MDITLTIIFNFSKDAVNYFLIYSKKSWELTIKLSFNKTEN